MIDNEFYKDLGERWYTSDGDAVALLRLENKTKTPWILDELKRRHQTGARVLDVGCGGGFLVLELARNGFHPTGLDVSDEVLAPGRARDTGKQIEWKTGDALNLPFAENEFDAVCIMDVLEHVQPARRAVEEALRVLKPGGTLFLHTFNRTFLGWLLAAKGLDWFIHGSQRHVHDWRLFIKPRELQAWVENAGGSVERWQGIHPTFKSAAKLLFTRRVPKDFTFALGGSRQVGYLGLAVKDVRKNAPA